jgi:hypothetical protein
MTTLSKYNDGVYDFDVKSVVANSATTVLDFEQNEYFKISLEASTTFSFTNALPGVYTLAIAQTGLYNISFPANVYFPNGIAPPAPTSPLSTLYTIVYDGTDFFASTIVDLNTDLVLDNFSGAEAAFSLYQLSSLTTNVVRVRRSTDNVEADFTAPEVTDGTMGNWVNTPYLRYQSDFSVDADGMTSNGGLITLTGGETIAGVSDCLKCTFTDATGNHFIQKLTGSSGQLHTDKFSFYIPSTNAVMKKIKLGFADTIYDQLDTWVDVTETDITSFYSRISPLTIADSGNFNGNGDVFYIKNVEKIQNTADGLVTTLFDQSGNGNRLLSATASKQPLIVDSGILTTVNGYQVIEHDNTDDELTSEAVINVTDGTVLMASTDGTFVFDATSAEVFNTMPFSNSTDFLKGFVAVVIWSDSKSTLERTAIKNSFLNNSYSPSFTTDSDIRNMFREMDIISGEFPEVDFSNATRIDGFYLGLQRVTSIPATQSLGNTTNISSAWASCSGLTSFPLLDFSNVQIFQGAWSNCSGLTSFPLIDISSATSLTSTWNNCSGLTSFPELVIPATVTSLSSTWSGCSGLTSFPLLDFSNITSFSSTWFGCSGLTSVSGSINVSSGTIFTNTWRTCSSLTSFPALSFNNNVTIFNYTWQGCSSLTTFPTNMFDTQTCTDFTEAFGSTNLTSQSIENIVVSLDTAGQSNGTLNISGGASATTATAQTAIDNLRARGWTVTVPDGY